MRARASKLCHRLTPRLLPGLLRLALIAALFAGLLPLPILGATARLDDTVRVDPQTKIALNGALKYLASQQQLNGSWSIKPGKGGYPIAITGYVLMAFMAMGNLPDEGDYAKQVSTGTQYLLDSMQPNGIFRDVSDGHYMYSHGFATLALAELFGESHSPVIRAKLQRAVDVILKAQSPSGGWRYSPNPRDADISVTVIQAVALRAAMKCGYAVPQAAIDRAIQYVESCHHPKTGGFSYQPGGGAGFARTAAATYSLQVLGKYDDPKVKTGSSYLFSEINDQTHWTYGNYYAAPAQYMIGGETWRKWYGLMRDTLMAKVQRSGDTAFWDPVNDGKKDLGPVYATAVYVHILAMPYHFVPLYQR